LANLANLRLVGSAVRLIIRISVALFFLNVD